MKTTLRDLAFLGACRQVGRSAIYYRTDSLRLLLDIGVKVHDHYELPLAPEPKPHATVVTHAHLDHSGAAPWLAKNVNAPVFTTFPTIPLADLLYEDSMKIARQEGFSLPFGAGDVKRLSRLFYPMGYNKPHQLQDGSKLTLLDAGHIVGSAMPLIESVDGHRLLYTGDFKVDPTRMHSGCAVPEEPVDTLVIESCYGDRDQPPREQIEAEFLQDVKDAIDEDGVALVPCFAVGRTQEILQVLADADLGVPIYTQGMGEKTSAVITQYTSYLRDPAALRAAIAGTTPASDRNKSKILAKPCVIVCTAGMLDGGPALEYLVRLNAMGVGRIILTGYQVEGTNGHRLLKTGRVRYRNKDVSINIPYTQRSFSAHSGKTELHRFVDAVAPQKVFVVHGDETIALKFVEDLNARGYHAVAPKAGETFPL